MIEVNVDFHIHSRYSGGTSRDMVLPAIAEQAELKGLNLIGTGDAQHPEWLKHMKENLAETQDGVYSLKSPKSKTHFLITTEVEDKNRVHHLILFPSIHAAEDFRSEIKKYSVDIDKDGRPHLQLNGEEIADYAKKLNAMIGPSHAFVPWTSIYKEYDSIKECYGSNAKEVKFLELGLSADSPMADRIRELRDLTFMSNSDSHSPQPHRLGREFNRLLVRDLCFEDVRKAVERRGGRRFTLNVGLNPREGKYHLTACTRCFLRFKIEDALRLNWRCPECRGIIKKGVADRIRELSQSDVSDRPSHRPNYVHILPLAEIISLASGIRTINSKRIQDEWDRIVKSIGTEIGVLIDANIEDVKKINPEVGRLVQKFRSGQVAYVAGGGGQYGRPTLSGEKDQYWGCGQTTLTEFSKH